jgi:hypothetical protein
MPGLYLKSLVIDEIRNNAPASSQKFLVQLLIRPVVKSCGKKSLRASDVRFASSIQKQLDVRGMLRSNGLSGKIIPPRERARERVAGGGGERERRERGSKVTQWCLHLSLSSGYQL